MPPCRSPTSRASRGGGRRGYTAARVPCSGTGPNGRAGDRLGLGPADDIGGLCPVLDRAVRPDMHLAMGPSRPARTISAPRRKPGFAVPWLPIWVQTFCSPGRLAHQAGLQTEWPAASDSRRACPFAWPSRRRWRACGRAWRRPRRRAEDQVRAASRGSRCTAWRPCDARLRTPAASGRCHTARRSGRTGRPDPCRFIPCLRRQYRRY